MNSEQLGGHTLEELRRMCGEDVFGVRSTLREYQYESGLSATLEPLTESQGRYPLESLHEGTEPMTADEVISELKLRLSKMLPNADLRVFKNTFMTTDVLVDCYALPPNSSQLDQANAKYKVRFSISSWKDGVPVGSLDARNVALPSDGKVVLKQLWGRDVPKLTKRTTTVAKALDTLVAWFKENASTFSPKAGWAMTARGAEPNMEGTEPGWKDAFPSVNAIDDFSSWANARDENDGTQPGVMGESGMGMGKLLPTDYEPMGMGDATQTVALDRLADPLHALARTMMLAADATQARYVKGLAVAIQKDDSKVAKEFFGKLLKPTKLKLPVNVLKHMGEGLGEDAGASRTRGYAKPLQTARGHLTEGEKELAAAEDILEGILASKPKGQARWDNPEDEAGRTSRQVGGSASSVRDTVKDLDKLLASLRG